MCWHFRDLLIRPYSCPVLMHDVTWTVLSNHRLPVSSPFRPDKLHSRQRFRRTPRLIRQQKPTDSRLPSPLSVLTLSIKNLRASHDTRFCSPAFDTQVRYEALCARTHKSGSCFRDMTNNQYTSLCQPPLPTRCPIPHKPPGPNCFTTLSPFPPLLPTNL